MNGCTTNQGTDILIEMTKYRITILKILELLSFQENKRLEYNKLKSVKLTKENELLLEIEE